MAYTPAESQNAVPDRSPVITSGPWLIRSDSSSATSAELTASISAGSVTTACRPDQATVSPVRLMAHPVTAVGRKAAPG